MNVFFFTRQSQQYVIFLGGGLLHGDIDVVFKKQKIFN